MQVTSRVKGRVGVAPDDDSELAAESLELAPPDLSALFVALAAGWATLADVLEEEHPTLFEGDAGDSGDHWVDVSSL